MTSDNKSKDLDRTGKPKFSTEQKDLLKVRLKSTEHSQRSRGNSSKGFSRKSSSDDHGLKSCPADNDPRNREDIKQDSSEPKSTELTSAKQWRRRHRLT